MTPTPYEPSTTGAPDVAPNVAPNIAAPRHRRRPGGFALILVVAFATIATITGFAMLEAASTSMPQALNQQGAARASDLASSGVAMATHFLCVPPSAVTPGNFWAGVSGFSIDGTADTVDVSVSRSASYQDNFVVTSIGTARDPDGSIRGRKTITTEVVTPPPVTWSLTRACETSSAVNIPQYPNFNGDVYANGNLISQASISGDAYATGTVTWTGIPGPTNKYPNSVATAMPNLTATAWNRYVVHGIVRAAQVYGSNTMSAVSLGAAGASSTTVVYKTDGTVAVLDTGGGLSGLLSGTVSTVGSILGLSGTSRTGPSVLSGSNAGGVIVVNSDLTISTGVTIIGTLIVNGDLNITTWASCNFCALPGYPALVVTGNIRCDLLASIEMRGPVLCGGLMRGDLANWAVFGSYMAYGTAFHMNLGKWGSAQFRPGSAYASFYDFSGSTVQPMTLVKWSE